LRYKELEKEIKDLVKDDPKARPLKKERADISQALQDLSALMRITAEMDENLHQQLLDNEAVHRCSMDELTQNRLGGEGTDKACYSLVVNTSGGPEILAGIFTYFVNARDTQGRFSHKSLVGSAEQAKDTLPIQMNETHNTAEFYTITSAYVGAGRILVQRVYELLASEYVLTTLSPVRDFTKDKDRDEWPKKPDAIIQKEVLNYLIQNSDPVLKFHLSNGAYIGHC
jgi:hypothetical protein